MTLTFERSPGENIETLSAASQGLLGAMERPKFRPELPIMSLLAERGRCCSACVSNIPSPLWHSFNSAFLYVLASPAGSHSFTLTIPMNINGAHAPQPPPSSSKAEGFFLFFGLFFFFYKQICWIWVDILFFFQPYFSTTLLSLSCRCESLCQSPNIPRLFPELRRAFACVGQRCLHSFFILDRECRCFIIHQVFWKGVWGWGWSGRVQDLGTTSTSPAGLTLFLVGSRTAGVTFQQRWIKLINLFHISPFFRYLRQCWLCGVSDSMNPSATMRFLLNFPFWTMQWITSNSWSLHFFPKCHHRVKMSLSLWHPPA